MEKNFLKAVEHIAYSTHKSNLLFFFCKSLDVVSNISYGNIKKNCDKAYTICVERYGKLVDDYLDRGRKALQSQPLVKVYDPSLPLEDQLR